MSDRSEHIYNLYDLRDEMIRLVALDGKNREKYIQSVIFAINSLEVDEAYQLEYEETQNIKAYAHDFGVSEEQPEKELLYSYKGIAKSFKDALERSKITDYAIVEVLKEIREEMEKLQTYKLFSGDTELYLSKNDVISALDKKIHELEGKE